MGSPTSVELRLIQRFGSPKLLARELLELTGFREVALRSGFFRQSFCSTRSRRTEQRSERCVRFTRFRARTAPILDRMLTIEYLFEPGTNLVRMRFHLVKTFALGWRIRFVPWVFPLRPLLSTNSHPVTFFYQRVFGCMVLRLRICL
jgi:hypothetical protein